MTFQVKTERLLIRDFREDDWQSIVARSTQEDVAKYMAWDTSTWAEKEKVIGWIREQQTLDLGTFGKYVEFAVELDGASIGVVGIKRYSEQIRLRKSVGTSTPRIGAKATRRKRTEPFLTTASSTSTFTASPPCATYETKGPGDLWNGSA